MGIEKLHTLSASNSEEVNCPTVKNWVDKIQIFIRVGIQIVQSHSNDSNEMKTLVAQ